MNTTAKPTPGPWHYETGGGHAYNEIRGADSVHIRGDLRVPGSNSFSDRICENLGDLNCEAVAANVSLICEAGTVYHETGLTPRQLADQRADLIAALTEIACCVKESAK